MSLCAYSIPFSCMIRYVVPDGVAVRGALRLRMLFDAIDASRNSCDDRLDPLSHPCNPLLFPQTELYFSVVTMGSVP